MKVRDVMTSKLTTITEKDALGLAQQLMLWGNFRHLPVVRGDTLVGIVSERDILVQRAEAPDWRTTTVKTAMTADPYTTQPGEDLAKASARMTEHKIDCLPVVDADALVGIVTTTDVLQSVDHAPARQVTARVKDIMTTEPEVAEAEESLFDAVSRMVENGIRHLPVVEEEGHIVGILSDRDVRTAVGDPIEALRGGSFEIEHLTVRQVMTPNPATVTPDASVSEAVNWFSRDRIGVLPVTDDDDRLVGVVSYLDALWYLKENAAKMAAAG